MSSFLQDADDIKLEGWQFDGICWKCVSRVDDIAKAYASYIDYSQSIVEDVFLEKCCENLYEDIVKCDLNLCQHNASTFTAWLVDAICFGNKDMKGPHSIDPLYEIHMRNMLSSYGAAAEFETIKKKIAQVVVMHVDSDDYVYFSMTSDSFWKHGNDITRYLHDNFKTKNIGGLIVKLGTYDAVDEKIGDICLKKRQQQTSFCL